MNPFRLEKQSFGCEEQEQEEEEEEKQEKTARGHLKTRKLNQIDPPQERAVPFVSGSSKFLWTLVISMCKLRQQEPREPNYKLTDEE